MSSLKRTARTNMMTNAVIDSLTAHRSIRKFKPNPVEPDFLSSILSTGVRAATGGNLQLYSLVIVDDAEKKQELQRELVNEGVFQELGQFDAPIVIVALADQYRIKKWFEVNHSAPICNNRAFNLFLGLWDAMIVLHNIVVAAESLGLGTCYIGGILSINIHRLLDAPEHVFPAGMVCIGYPDESPELSVRLPLEAVVHRNKYRVPTDDNIRSFYKEREGIWETVSEELKERLGKENIHNIPQAVAVQKFSEQIVTARSKGIIENLKRAKFVLKEDT